jgi:hypothetical protein
LPISIRHFVLTLVKHSGRTAIKCRISQHGGKPNNQ